MKITRICMPLLLPLALAFHAEGSPVASPVLLLANPNLQFQFVLQEVHLPKHPVLRQYYMQAIREHYDQDPALQGKLRDAKKKARAITVHIYGAPQDGWIYRYWEVEKLVMQNDLGIRWWMTPMEADPASFAEH
jgi:hypothetical protein